MKLAAGVLIKFKNKILLCHPTNAAWKNSFSPPKGGLDEGEDIVDAAVRECFEETSIVISKSQIQNIDDPVIIDYKNKKSGIYKRVYLYIVNISSLSEIGLQSENVDKSELQIEEIDWAGFLTKKEATERVFWRLKDILTILN